jgi:site-specific DNA recombinase
VGYIRVSEKGDRSDERFQSPDLQRDAMQRWVTATYGDDHQWLEFFTDLDMSGTNIDRPQLKSAVSLARRESADIVVYNLGRYSRSVPEGLGALEKLGEVDVQVLSASENVDTSTPEGILTLTIFLAMHQYQVQQIQSQWRNTIRSNKTDGWWHGRIPFGYRRPTKAEAATIGRESGVIVPDEQRARIVQELFRRFLGGESAQALGEEAVRKGWTRRTSHVRDILRNPAYAGYVTLGERKPALKKNGQVRRDTHGRIIYRPDPDTTYQVRARHEPLVSDEDFNAASEKLLATSTLARSTKPPQHLRYSAAGLTRCGSCRHTLAYHDKEKQQRPDGHGGVYLICVNKNCRNRPVTARLAEFEVALAEAVADLPLVLQDVRGELARRDSLDLEVQALEAIEARYKKAKAAADRARDVVLGGTWDEFDMTEDEARASMARLRTHANELAGELDSTPHVAPERILDAYQVLVGQANALSIAWPHLEYSDRIKLLASIGATCLVSPNGRAGAPLAGRFILEVPWCGPGQVPVALVKG